MAKRIRSRQKRRNGQARTNNSGPFQELMLSEKKPSHIVVFREESEKRATALLKKHVSLFPENEKRNHGVAFLRSGRGGVPLGQQYRQLGIAAVDLTHGQAQALSEDVGVMNVFPNEWRPFPRPLHPRVASSQELVHGPSRQSLEDRIGPRQPFDERTGPNQPFGSGIEGYLMGYRDAIDTLLRTWRSDTTADEHQAVRRNDDDGDFTWGTGQIGIEEVQLNGAGVAVAVLDTGIERHHPEFARNFKYPERFKNFVDESKFPEDDVGHGTHVCGTIAGAAMTRPRYSVAPECDLYVGKVLARDGGWDSDILAGIQWAVSAGVRVINLSLGSPRHADEPYAKPYEIVAARFMDRRNRPLIVAAAGNESERPSHIAPVGNPAACPSILAVAAVDSHGRIAQFSCGGIDNIGEINIAAPGVDVYSTLPKSPKAEYNSSNGFGFLSGTSMAAPHVTGLAALHLQAADVRRESLTVSQLWDRVMQTAHALRLPVRDVGRGLAYSP